MRDTKQIVVLSESPNDLLGKVTVEGSAEKALFTSDPLKARAMVCSGHCDTLIVQGAVIEQFCKVFDITDRTSLIETLPIGIALVDENQKIVHSNRQFHLWSKIPDPEGELFYKALGYPSLLGPDFSPFHMAVSQRRAATTELRDSSNRYYEMEVFPAFEDPDSDSAPVGPTKLKWFSVVLRDVTAISQLNQKMELLQKAGAQLADLMPDELLTMSVEQRVELLKTNIIQSTKDILHYDVMEIRLLNLETNELEPLLAVGMEEEATRRKLYATPQGNGVTGFVAYTGKSYLCEDTTEDPLYLHGSAGAKSSLTVPLMFREETVGTLNIESPEPRAFTITDQQFLDILSLNIASAIHTLELLTAEKATTAVASMEAIHRAVAIPISKILNSAVAVLNTPLNVEPAVMEDLKEILAAAREIHELVLTVGERLTPVQAHPVHPVDRYSPLKHRRVLIVDPDSAALLAANDILVRFHCNVESAPTGERALQMVREENYDAIISDIRLADMNGYHLMLKLREILNSEKVPLILMKGFGYDADHVVVNTRQAGLKLFLSKPFVVPQFLKILEHAVNGTLPEEKKKPGA